MSKIILTTLNARYIHTALGLRYIKANMGVLVEETHIVEFVISTRPVDIAEQLLRLNPEIIGIGIYIWNIQQSTELVSIIKQISPHTLVVLGGPEISHDASKQAITQLSDYIISGYADLAFGELCDQLLHGPAPLNKFISAPNPRLKELALPYQYYNDDDIKNRVIYVEASRGCPFKCEFCLSALDKTAWSFPQNEFLDEMEKLYNKGVRRFKFVDRTFNLKITDSIRIMTFFIERIDKHLFVHFELIPDRLPEELKQLILQFPSNTLQFEVGVQSLTPIVQKLINRKQNNELTLTNLRWLHSKSAAHIHADLIIGLPGETMATFAHSFDQLIGTGVQEIQVGILKRLKGTPIDQHTLPYDMKYHSVTPYSVLSTQGLSFAEMQRLSRFARYWDLIGNSGRFNNTLPLLLGKMPFQQFMLLSDWLYLTTQQTHQIALTKLFDLLFQGLSEALKLDSQKIYTVLIADYHQSGLKGQAKFAEALTQKTPEKVKNYRQNRHKKM
ncbi:MAG: DUF4080 domain-containing protein [Gammaproteobacteria bacterium]|nr:DUF4080 domain-containing protein [Gammaproteobacteria bacterium]